jgi:(2R)-sulfolactate sulfo-lyase subunit alpha
MSDKPKQPKYAFLMHDAQDTVGVAVADIKSGDEARGRALHGDATPSLKSLSDIPLGHKIALKDFQPGDTVIKYGVDIGRIVAPVKKGEHVHVHNLKTKRW